MAEQRDAERWDDRVLLGLLLEHHPAHLARHELKRELGWDAVRVEDSSTRLARAGLAHRQDEFAFATRAAVRFDALGL